MQRSCRRKNCPAVDFVTAYARSAPVAVQLPEWIAKHSSGDSNAHNAQRASTKAEAPVFQRTREAGSELLAAGHTHGNGIHQKTGSKRV
jgi:UDP-2,3-diacylglucosamine pyrophosphatase LpxH